MSTQRVRDELKLLRKVNKMTVDYIEAEKILHNKEKILGKEGVDELSSRNLEGTRKKISDLISSTAELESKYMAAFDELTPTGRKIIIEKVINCHGNRYIAFNLGYSEVSIEKKLNAIYKRLSALLYGDE